MPARQQFVAEAVGHQPHQLLFLLFEGPLRAARAARNCASRCAPAAIEGRLHEIDQVGAADLRAMRRRQLRREQIREGAGSRRRVAARPVVRAGPGANRRRKCRGPGSDRRAGGASRRGCLRRCRHRSGRKRAGIPWRPGPVRRRRGPSGISAASPCKEQHVAKREQMMQPRRDSNRRSPASVVSGSGQSISTTSRSSGASTRTISKSSRGSPSKSSSTCGWATRTGRRRRGALPAGKRAFAADERIDEGAFARAGSAECRDDQRRFEADAERFDAREQPPHEGPAMLQRLPRRLGRAQCVSRSTSSST